MQYQIDDHKIQVFESTLLRNKLDKILQLLFLFNERKRKMEKERDKREKE